MEQEQEKENTENNNKKVICIKELKEEKKEEDYDKYGFSSKSKRSLNNIRGVDSPNEEKEDLQKWKETLEKFACLERKEIKFMIYSGIPEKIRPLVWLNIASMKRSSFGNSYKFDKSFYSYYTKMWEKCNILTKKLTASNTAENGELKRQIEVDVARTFKDHYYFEDENSEGRKRLQALLLNYSNFNKKIKYCQGQNEIAASVLLVCSDDITAFAIFSSLMERLEGYFETDLWELKEDSSLFEWLLKKQFPLIWEHIKKNNIAVEMFFTKWILTCFGFLPFNLHVRILDFILLEGLKAIYKIAMAIFVVHEENILRCEGIEELLPYLLTLPMEGDIPFDKNIQQVYIDIPIDDFLQVAPKFSLKKRMKRSHLRQPSR